MRAAIYLRVSTEDQAKHGYSINSQRDRCTSMALDLGANEIVEFLDEGIPGEVINRPGLSSLRDAVAKKGDINLVVCYDPDRLARKLALQLILTDEIEKAGSRLEFVDFDWQNTPDGRLFYSLRGAIAEYEKEKIRERTLRGKLQKARQGGMPTSVLNYGLTGENGATKIVQDEANVIKLIFRWFTTEDLGINGVAQRLADEGILTKKGNTKWQRCVVKGILENPAYIGIKYYNRLDTKGKTYNKYVPDDKKVKAIIRPEEEWIAIPVPAIIDEEIFLKAQEKLKSIRRMWAGWSLNNYLLSGIISCSDCGNTMHGCSALTKKKTKIRQYTCVKTPAGASKRGCSPIKYVSADDVEEIVWSQVCEWLNNPELLMAELKDDKQIKELESDLKRYNDLIANVEKGRANMVSALASGLLDLDANTKKTMQDLKLREKNLKERKKELERSLNKNTATVAQIKNIHHRLKDFLSSLDHLQFEQKKLLVREIVRQVVVSGRGKDMRVTIHTAFREAALQQSATRQQMPII